MPDTPIVWKNGEKFKRLLHFQQKLNKRPPRSETRFNCQLENALKGSKYTIERNKIVFSSKDKACPTRGKGFLIDFFIPELELGFEIDGRSHDSSHAQQYDAIRDSFIGSKGIRIIRIRNDETFKDLTSLINRHLSKREQEIKKRYQWQRHNETPKAIINNSVEEFLNNGGTITQCPPANKKKGTRCQLSISIT